MKAIKALLIGMATAALTACGGLTGTTGGLGAGSNGSASAGGDLLGSVISAVSNPDALGNVVKSVIGTDKPKQSDLIATWYYKQPGAAFTSENLLAKAGGEVAATQVKEKLASYYSTVGINSSNTVIQFKEDNTFSGKIDGKTISGTYTYNEAECKISMKMLLVSATAYAKKTTTGMSILFESKKLLSLLQTMAAMSGNSTMETIGDLSKNYDGVRVGFDMKK
ncbi:MAG: DUF4923 family protein [Prevotella sp.]|nr:DUF4923 family protein [Prevotella sp.]